MPRMREKLPQRALVKVTNDAPFYVDYLRRELEENYSNAVLTKEGLRIYSSLDLQHSTNRRAGAGGRA